MSAHKRKIIPKKGSTPGIHRKKCCICGKPVCTDRAEYCLVCRDFAIRMSVERLPQASIQDIWESVRKNGYVCFYTGMALDMSSPTSPWYGVLDHWIPGDNRKVVLTSALFNEMKSDLSEVEFWYYVEELYNFKKNGTPIRKKRVVYWQGLVGPGRGIYKEGPTPKIHGKKCCICRKPVCSNHSKYCSICRQFAAHMRVARLPPLTVQSIWAYVRQHGYVCYYTGMALDMRHRKSPWYGVLDHWIPGDNKKVVLTSDLFNEMKSDLSEKEFWYYIEQLYHFKKNGTSIRKKRLVYWERLVLNLKPIISGII
ncbi:MAG: hypothetical protein HQL12_03740 [Candidatus Omnitrophica bacterium]|nr:hypothetical protein [Candidatus Omnitrophota bacterium]